MERMPENMTVVDEMGKVIRTCENPRGIMLVDVYQHRPIMRLGPLVGENGLPDEVFADVTIDICQSAGTIVDNKENAESGNAEFGGSQYYLSTDRRELTEEFVPSWLPEECRR